MKWMDEMFADMENDRVAESATRGAKVAKVEEAEHLREQIRGATDVWRDLFSSITNDVQEFNKHAKRVGQTPVCISHRDCQCEVYLPGMQSKRLVLTLNNNDLHVAVHPEFPRQQSTITIEPDYDGKHGFWILGEHTKESAKLSAQQLSEYLLKPILSSAAINRP
jgi:hypothetical protein